MKSNWHSKIWNIARPKSENQNTDGFVEKFKRTVLEEFFRAAFTMKLYESVHALQEDLDKWLMHYVKPPTV